MVLDLLPVTPYHVEKDAAEIPCACCACFWVTCIESFQAPTLILVTCADWNFLIVHIFVCKPTLKVAVVLRPPPYYCLLFRFPFAGITRAGMFWHIIVVNSCPRLKVSYLVGPPWRKILLKIVSCWSLRSMDWKRSSISSIRPGISLPIFHSRSQLAI